MEWTTRLRFPEEAGMFLVAVAVGADTGGPVPLDKPDVK
jgi:hypothetical protein